MSEHSLYRRIITGEAGSWASPLRGLLRMAETVYGGAVTLRNGHYNRRGPRTAIPIPVVSVGNITVGGTGKTPFVIELVGRLERMGLSPAVISRGYKAAEGEPNDEERLIRKRCPGVIRLSDPDRGRGGEMAYRRFGANVIVLDDGFQHRRLARSLDIVLVDATCPFGYGHLIPRGLLREPVGALRRAHVVVLTRCDQASRAGLAGIEARLREIINEATLLKCNHRVTAIERLDGTPANGSLAGKRAVLFAGIGRPQSFVDTASSLGVEVVGRRWWSDHHRYRVGDVDGLLKTQRFPPYDVLLTTEKDAVKIAELGQFDHAAIFVVRVAIDFIDNGGTMLQSVLRKSLLPELARNDAPLPADRFGEDQDIQH